MKDKIINLIAYIITGGILVAVMLGLIALIKFLLGLI